MRKTYRVLNDNEFIRAYKEIGPTALSNRLNQSQRAIYARRTSIQRRVGITLSGPIKPLSANLQLLHGISTKPGRLHMEIKNGVCLVGSDCHYWPGAPSLMHRAFVHFCELLAPKLVVLDGDVLDFAAISRHPPIGWERLPTVQEEIEAAQERVSEIEKAAGKARKVWPMGNHDQRFATCLATHAVEFAKVHGVQLRDHFPKWEACWRIDLNRDVIIKHRGKGGKHAAYNNSLHSGVTTVTGHLHSQSARAITDARGTRWGIDPGCIADPDHLCFLDYTEDSPYKDWRDGFCVLTFRDGRLLPPELVHRWDDDHVVFRGEVIRV